MITFNIGHYRLFNQGISETRFEQPAQVVAHLGAIQAQDYAGALWAIGLRLKQTTQITIEQAIANRTIIRTWPMRGTLHFVAAADARWLLKLLTPRVISSSVARRRQLELDDQVLALSRKIIIKALEEGKQLTRQQIYTVLEQGNISPDGQRGYHILGQLSQEGLLCFGSHQDNQPTFVLLEEWLPPAKNLERDEALAELAKRYFTSHGPATVQDFERWTGLKTSDAKAGLETVKTELYQEAVDGQVYWFPRTKEPSPAKTESVYLLPGFDEYISGYKDRSAVIEPQYFQKVVPGGNGVFMSTIVSSGRVVGLWKRATKKAKIVISPAPFTELNLAEKEALPIAAAHYSHFIGLPIEIN